MEPIELPTIPETILAQDTLERFKERLERIIDTIKYRGYIANAIDMNFSIADWEIHVRWKEFSCWDLDDFDYDFPISWYYMTDEEIEEQERLRELKEKEERFARIAEANKKRDLEQAENERRIYEVLKAKFDNN